MSNSKNAGLITDLLTLALQYGASVAEAQATLQKNGVDPAEYQAVIDDKRTFKDFHGENPQGETGDQPPPPKPAGAQYFKAYDLPIPPDEDLRALGFIAGDVVQESDDRAHWRVVNQSIGASGWHELRTIAE